MVQRTHSRIGDPLAAVKGSPVPAATRPSTRCRGSFSTRPPPTTIAKIEPSTVSAADPNPRRPLEDGGPTPGRVAMTSTRTAKRSAGSIGTIPTVLGRDDVRGVSVPIERIAG